MQSQETRHATILENRRRYRQRREQAQTIGVCECGKSATYWSAGGYVCNSCREIEAMCLQHGLRNDRVKAETTPDGKRIPNPEYLKRYSHEYHKNKHLPKEERCMRARAAAALPLAVHEEREAALCECGYPAAYNETKCTVCLYLCHTLTKNNSVNSNASIA